MNHPLNAGFSSSATAGVQVAPIRNSGAGGGQHRRALLDRFVLTVYPNICNSGRTHVLLFLQYVFRCWHTGSTGGHSRQHRRALLCAKCITQLVAVPAGAAVPLFSLSAASPKINECPFSHFSSSETVPLRMHGCMESMDMKQHPFMTLHFCSENPCISPFEEPKTEVVDTPEKKNFNGEVKNPANLFPETWRVLSSRTQCRISCVC